MKATIGIKVARLDSDSQMVANFKISLYITVLKDIPQAFGIKFEEMGVLDTCAGCADIYDQILEIIQLIYA